MDVEDGKEVAFNFDGNNSVNTLTKADLVPVRVLDYSRLSRRRSLTSFFTDTLIIETIQSISSTRTRPPVSPLAHF